MDLVSKPKQEQADALEKAKGLVRALEQASCAEEGTDVEAAFLLLSKRRASELYLSVEDITR